MTLPIELNDARLRIHTSVKRSRRRGSAHTPASPDLETILIEAIERVNARAARREADARREQDELIRLLRWSIKMVEASKARSAVIQSAPQAAAMLADEVDDADEYR